MNALGRACPDCGGNLDACAHAAKVSASQLAWETAVVHRGKLRRSPGPAPKDSPRVGYSRDEIVAMTPRLTRSQLDEALALDEWLPQEDERRAKLAAGEAYVGRIYDELVRERRRSRLLSAVPELPRDKYHVIVADPPWKYDDDGEGRPGAAESHYPTTSLEGLKAMRSQIDAIAANDCVLVMWATSPLLPDAFALMEAWGFEYKSSGIWHKTGRMGMGSILRIDHEVIIFGVRGNGIAVADRSVRSVFSAPVGAHSAKPFEFYEIIERLYPDAKKIELFARTRRDGWDSWGAEAPAKREVAA